MGIRSVLRYLAILCAMHTGLLAYMGFICVEPEHGKFERLVYYLLSTEIRKVCPTPVEVAYDILWVHHVKASNSAVVTELGAFPLLSKFYEYMFNYFRRRIRRELFCAIACELLTLLIINLSSVTNIVRERLSSLVLMAKEWKNRPSPCRYCGTAPCQVLRRSSCNPPAPRDNCKVDYSDRSNAMMLFNCGLEVSTILTKELSQDDLYWERRACERFEEEHMRLFPLCIRRQIDHWYPIPR